MKKTTIIIPDIHMNTRWADEILAQRSSADKYIFLGDYFDTHLKHGLSGAKQTAQWLLDTKVHLGDKAVFMIGNHDLPYFEEVWRIQHTLSKYARKPHEKNFLCCGYTRNKGKAVCSVEGIWDFFKDLQLAHVSDGYCFSHAGFNAKDFNFCDTPEAFVAEAIADFDLFKHRPLVNPFSCYLERVGLCRGGRFEVGGPLWQDWNFDFQPIEGFKQIVGHTCGDDPREKSGNLCIDCGQTSYLILDDEGVRIEYA